MRPSTARLRPARHLAIVQVWVHGRVGVEKPCIDKSGSVGGIVVFAGDAPCHDIVEDRVSESTESAGVVDEANVRVKLAITGVVCALRPD